MYRKQVFKYYVPYYEKTGKENVLPSLIEDYSYAKPSFIMKTKTIVHIGFNNRKFLCSYTIPINTYKKIFESEEAK